jgi:hypothetical protein
MDKKVCQERGMFQLQLAIQASSQPFSAVDSSFWCLVSPTIVEAAREGGVAIPSNGCSRMRS